MRNKNYYFAYGSNLNEKQMKERCPDSKLLGVAVLKNYRLDFTIYSSRWNCGCADVLKDDGKEVWGLLYTLSEEDLQKLDKFEGNPDFYRRIQVDVIDKMGKSIKSYTYDVVNKSPFQMPSSKYLNIIKGASMRFNFSKNYQDFLEKIEFIS